MTRIEGGCHCGNFWLFVNNRHSQLASAYR